MVDIITTYITQERMWVHTINLTKYLSISRADIYMFTKQLHKLPFGSTNRHGL